MIGPIKAQGLELEDLQLGGWARVGRARVAMSMSSTCKVVSRVDLPLASESRSRRDKDTSPLAAPQVAKSLPCPWMPF